MVAIFVLVLFLSALIIDLLLLNFQGKYHPAFEQAFSPLDKILFNKNNYLFPSDLQLSKGHTWLRKNNDGTVDLGLDSFGKIILGTVPIISYAAEGRQIKLGDILFEATRGDNKIKFLSPINGNVKAINKNLDGNLISDTYSTWNLKLIPENYSENEKMLISGKKAKNWIKNEFKELKKFIDLYSPENSSTGVTMYDGGSISDDAVSFIVFNNSNDFEMKFQSNKSEN